MAELQMQTTAHKSYYAVETENGVPAIAYTAEDAEVAYQEICKHAKYVSIVYFGHGRAITLQRSW